MVRSRARRLRLGLAVLIAALGAAGCARRAARETVPGEAARFPEHYAHSIAALGFPGAHRAFQVGNGCVVSSGETALEWHLLSAPAAVCSPVWFERDGIPVAHWEIGDAHQRVSFEAAAAPAPALGDSSLVLSVQATATWLGPSPGEVVIEARIAGVPDSPHFVPWDATESTRYDEAWNGTAAVRNGRLVAVVDEAATLAGDAPYPSRPAHTDGPGPGALRARCSARLARGEHRSFHFWMPLYPTALDPRRLEDDAAHERVAPRARRMWSEYLARAARLQTPDSLVNTAWRAASVTLVQGQEKAGDHWVPIGNPFQYRDVWLRDGARVVRALALVGLTDFAVDDARTLARFQLPVGALLSQHGQIDGTGQALWAFAQAASLPPTASVARELLPAATGGARWIARQCAMTEQLRVPWGGLLPFADPRDGELTRAQLVGNDAWGIAGLDATAALARLAGESALADTVAGAARAYRGRFLAALVRSGAADVPPSWQGVGRDWGNLAVGYPTLALPPGDARIERLERRCFEGGGGSGLVSYGAANSLHTYLGADLAVNALLAGRPEVARDYLDGLLAHSSSTLGQAEIVHRAGGFGTNLPPHGTAAATLVDLLRTMIVSDLGDTLEIGLGAGLAWWNGTRLERAATRFGVLDVGLERPAEDQLVVRLSAAPAPVRVRVPDGVMAVSSADPGVLLEGPHWVQAPKGTEQIRFQIANAGPR